MDVKTNISGNRMEMVLSGKLDSVSSPDFTEKTLASLTGITDLILDLGNLEYISSAGLRALLVLQQKLSDTDGGVSVRNVPQSIRDVFEVTGFDLLFPEV